MRFVLILLLLQLTQITKCNKLERGEFPNTVQIHDRDQKTSGKITFVKASHGKNKRKKSHRRYLTRGRGREELKERNRQREMIKRKIMRKIKEFFEKQRRRKIEIRNKAIGKDEL